MKIYVTALEALEKNERRDETQLSSGKRKDRMKLSLPGRKIGGKTSFIYVTALEALEKNERRDETQLSSGNKERQDETQFTRKENWWKKLVWVPIVSFCKIFNFIPSYMFDGLLC